MSDLDTDELIVTSGERAVEAELQIVKALLESEAKDHPERAPNEEHAKLLIEAQLEDAKSKIPYRWKAEEIAKREISKANQIKQRLSKALEVFLEHNVSTAQKEIKLRLAVNLVEDWNKRSRQRFEDILEDAYCQWYKPGDDPLQIEATKISTELDEMEATVGYHLSENPELEKKIRPPTDGNTTSANLQNITIHQAPKNIVHFDAAKLIGYKFNGDTSDPEVYLKFNVWKAAWIGLVGEMRSLPGFDNVKLFQKLKDCLSDNALLLASKYTADSDNSYDCAIKDLMQRYQNPVRLAASYMKKMTTPGLSLYERAEQIKNANEAIHGMHDVFNREGVKMADFAIILSSINAMEPEMAADWNAFVVKQKEDFEAKRETLRQEGQDEPEWKEGVIYNYATFLSWLRMFMAKHPESSKAESTSSAANFAVSATSSKQGSKGNCFICRGDNHNGHDVSYCPKALAMSLKTWRQVCKGNGLCYQCTKTFEPGHQKSCKARCPICQRKTYNSKHHSVVCPMNKFRTAPLEVNNSSSKFSGAGRKRQQSHDNDDAKMAKMAKLMGEQFTKAFNNLNPSIPSNNGKGEKEKKRSKKPEKK